MQLNMTTELIEEVVHEALQHISRQGREHHIQVQQDNEFILVKMDTRLMIQVIINLIDNAIKYTEDDGHVTFTVRTNDRHLYISVADNGPGISDSDKKKIFDRFYRVDKARTRQKGGFGLGLSLAQQIVLALKGTIVVKDNQPKGTIFEVKITGV